MEEKIKSSKIKKDVPKTVEKSKKKKSIKASFKEFKKNTVDFLKWLKKQFSLLNILPKNTWLKKHIKQVNVIILVSTIILLILSFLSLTVNLDYLLGKQQSRIRYIKEDGIKYIGIKDGYITEKLIVEAGEKLPDVGDYFSDNYSIDKKHSITYYLGEAAIPVESFSVKGEDGVLYVIGSNNTLSVKINNFDEEYSTNLLITDSTAPTIQLEPVTITQGEVVDPLAFVAIFIDNSRSFDFTAEFITEGTYNNPGTYEVEIKVCDMSNNCSKGKTNLIVEKKTSSSGNSGNKKPSSGTTNPSGGNTSEPDNPGGSGGSSGGSGGSGGSSGNSGGSGGSSGGSGGSSGGSSGSGGSGLATAPVRVKQGTYTKNNYTLSVNYYGTIHTAYYKTVTYNLYDDGFAEITSYSGKSNESWNYSGFSNNLTSLSYMKRDALTTFVANKSYYDAAQSVFLDASNTERSKVNVSNLSIDNDLNVIAQIRCYEIVYGNMLGHTRPGGKKVKDLIKTEYGYVAGKYTDGLRYYGENIAYGQPDHYTAITELIASSGHYENIVKPAFKKMGVGALYDSANRRWIRVQIFTS